MDFYRLILICTFLVSCGENPQKSDPPKVVVNIPKSEIQIYTQKQKEDIPVKVVSDSLPEETQEDDLEEEPSKISLEVISDDIQEDDIEEDEPVLPTDEEISKQQKEIEKWISID